MISAGITSARLIGQVLGWNLPARHGMEVVLSMTPDAYRELDPSSPVYITQEPDALAKAWAEGHEQGMDDVGRQITDRHYSGHTKNPYQA